MWRWSQLSWPHYTVQGIRRKTTSNWVDRIWRKYPISALEGKSDLPEGMCEPAGPPYKEWTKGPPQLLFRKHHVLVVPCASLKATLYINHSPGKFETEKKERGVLKKDKVNQTWMFLEMVTVRGRFRGNTRRERNNWFPQKFLLPEGVKVCSHSVSGRVW